MMTRRVFATKALVWAALACIALSIGPLALYTGVYTKARHADLSTGDFLSYFRRARSSESNHDGSGSGSGGSGSDSFDELTTTDAPTTEAPNTDAPITDAPNTDAPNTDAPTLPSSVAATKAAAKLLMVATGDGPIPFDTFLNFDGLTTELSVTMDAPATEGDPACGTTLTLPATHTVLSSPYSATFTTDETRGPKVNFPCEAGKSYVAIMYDFSYGYHHGSYYNIPCCTPGTVCAGIPKQSGEPLVAAASDGVRWLTPGEGFRDPANPASTYNTYGFSVFEATVGQEQIDAIAAAAEETGGKMPFQRVVTAFGLTAGAETLAAPVGVAWAQTKVGDTSAIFFSQIPSQAAFYKAACANLGYPAADSPGPTVHPLTTSPATLTVSPASNARTTDASPTGGPADGSDDAPADGSGGGADADGGSGGADADGGSGGASPHLQPGDDASLFTSIPFLAGCGGGAVVLLVLLCCCCKRKCTKRGPKSLSLGHWRDARDGSDDTVTFNLGYAGGDDVDL